MRHPIRGLLIGPLAAPFAYWIGVMAWAGLVEARFDGFQALRELKLILVFGIPIAYAAALAWGAPALYLLHRLGWLRPAPVVLAGAVGGIGVAALFALGQQGSLIQVRMPWAGGAAIGALAAFATWRAGQDRHLPDDATG
ncbi:MAG: hypothetical protein ABI409_03115 [Ramlibacter sp.]